jgi:hypothetical protein
VAAESAPGRRELAVAAAEAARKSRRVGRLLLDGMNEVSILLADEFYRARGRNVMEPFGVGFHRTKKGRK